MGALNGRIAIITGAGRGIGREEALLFAAEGAKVVVNDSGADRDGTGSDPAVAQGVVDEITAMGGDAVANTADVATMDGAQAVLDQCLAAFGDVQVVVNNAGMLRDRMFVSMTEEEWDTVIRGHLKTTFCMGRVAAGHWREQAKAGAEPKASMINTSSTSGLIGAVGQSNYGAAKAGIAAMTVIIAQELGRYGVRVNAISPAARTRMTVEAPGVSDMVREPEDPADFDVYHPRHPAPVVGWLATEDCPVTGRVFMVKGGDIRPYTPWTRQDFVAEERDFTIAEVEELMRDLPPLPEAQ